MGTYPTTMAGSAISMLSSRALSSSTYYFMSEIHRQLMDKNPGLVFQSGAWEKETNTYGSIWTSQDNSAPVKPNFCYKEKQVEVSFPNGKTVTAIAWNTDLCQL